MSIDIAQFAQIFMEEAAEHLASMESGLLGLDLQAADPETLNAIFRAAHSIKGGAGTFGMDAIADFTHSLETLLDRIRHGERRFDEACLDACLRSVDLLRLMLDAHAGGEPCGPDVAAELVEELQTLLASGSESALDPGLGSPPASGQFDALDKAPGFQANQGLSLYIRVPAEQGGKRESVERLLVSLAEIGTLDVYECPSEEAESLCWRASLVAGLDASALRDFAEFVIEPDWLEIASMASGPSMQADAVDESYGFFEPVGVPDTGASMAAKGMEDEGFGFFDSAPGVPLAASGGGDDGEGYGFFEPVGAPEALADDPQGGEAGDVGQALDQDRGYGFFEPHKPDASDGSYGFFEPVAAEPAVPSAEAATPKPQPKSLPEPAPANRSKAQANVAPAGGAGAASAGDASIRVPTHKIDQLINLVGELVITQSMLKASAELLDPVEHEQLMSGLAQLERNSRDLQESVLSTRMVPMSVVFSRYPRIVRDIAKKLGKQVDLQLIGESVELDKGMVERIVDPLTHLVRNSVDHGLEMPEARLAQGKKPTGTIMLIAEHQSGQIVIEIVDDGAGLNRDRILDKARKQGMAVDQSIPDSEVWDLIFAPGFSTAETVTEVSGRGVGMDVVRKNILALGGSVQLDSTAGHGTRVTIRLPLTLAILDGMTVRANSDDFIIPLAMVVESLPTDKLSFKSVGRSASLVRIREEYVPMASLAALLGIVSEPIQRIAPVVVVLEFEGKRMAVGVDALLGQQQVVVKNLESNYRRVRGISGATILGNGQVALILDVAGLARLIQSSHHS